ncbi:MULTISPECIES: ABC transporter substrate-binding protein [unclassified Chelatococcus]|jgi:putative spermidine/putrescine transport system substrate-binding protein|uniref:ABC transporter substrate-binding protein n=1 Tax=unclassified Chelatococcus TaxID=2638111 RepID=UPI001BCE96D6|nr:MULTISPECIES: ABC transporter substrate-binding protein [unclassified Chelatococcus]CAH1660865.1 putative spermidine/putrescine transport system substrate-binding protein [Hyphomicrobiales bacterium]MBS7741180.1 ABC transporter substrate-binding protein [Chelatococcus sp. HY11]MBX3545366.1 ABC transporter substrate-binding protein [Chelatococcus sp.]MCO5078001.1 ABC transporter substrate-binding protein [Chelatococcus sp.]CAH1683270.1 putative spermidine/putrescine transport system substrat
MGKFLAAMAISLAATLSAQAQTRELVVGAFGGAYTEALKKNIAQFEKDNDVKVTFVPASGADGLAKAMAKEIDVVHADMAWAYRGEAQGAFEKLDPKVITNLDKLYPRARFSEYGVITNFGEYGIAFNPKEVSPAPTSWLDLWNPKYDGAVSTTGFDAANIELLVLMAKLNGGNEDNIDPGFQKMAELGKHITVFYSQHPQLLDLFRNNEVVISRWLRGRVDWANKQGVSLGFAAPKEGAIALVSTVHVVKGRPNTELAQKFVNHLLSVDGQMTYASDLGYTPARAGLDLKGINVPYGEDVVGSLLIADWKKIVPKMDAWKERWEKEVVAR